MDFGLPVSWPVDVRLGNRLRSGQSLRVQVAEEAEGAEEQGDWRKIIAARDDSAR